MTTNVIEYSELVYNYLFSVSSSSDNVANVFLFLEQIRSFLELKI